MEAGDPYFADPFSQTQVYGIEGDLELIGIRYE